MTTLTEQRVLPSRGRKIGPRPDWLAVVVVVLIIFNGLPFLAPVFMKFHWDGIAQAIYYVYGFLCHQMAQRSFFLFGPKLFQMYNLSDLPVQVTGLNQLNQMLVLRNFVGNDQLGWKVAWSDRMVAMYTAPLLVAIAYAFLRKLGSVKPLTLWGFALLLVPMAIDGGSHWVSDFAGLGQGFRDSNIWLATLTNQAFPASFYSGDSLGSYNSFMRLFSGVTFGIAVGGLIYPYVDLYLAQTSTPSSRFTDIGTGGESLAFDPRVGSLSESDTSPNPTSGNHQLMEER